MDVTKYFGAFTGDGVDGCLDAVDSKLDAPTVAGDKGQALTLDQILKAQWKTLNTNYLFVKYAQHYPTQDSDMSDDVGPYVGIYYSVRATAPTIFTMYRWYKLPGAAGDTGPKGNMGDKGLTGDEGPRGVTGKPLKILGYVGTAAELGTVAPNPNDGDAYIVGNDIDVYDAEYLQWRNYGPIEGPEGLQGIKGDTGDQGPQGDQGVQGSPVSVTVSELTNGVRISSGGIDTDIFNGLSSAVSGTKLIWIGSGTEWVEPEEPDEPDPPTPEEPDEPSELWPWYKVINTNGAITSYSNPQDSSMLNSKQNGYDIHVYAIGAGGDATDVPGTAGRTYAQQFSIGADESYTIQTAATPSDTTTCSFKSVNPEYDRYAEAGTYPSIGSNPVNNKFTGVKYGVMGVDDDSNLDATIYGCGGNTVNGRGSQGCVLMLPYYTNTYVYTLGSGVQLGFWPERYNSSGVYVWLIGADPDGNGSKAYCLNLSDSSMENVIIPGGSFSYRLGDADNPDTTITYNITYNGQTLSSTTSSASGSLRPQGVRDWTTGIIHGGHSETGTIIICYDSDYYYAAQEHSGWPWYQVYTGYRDLESAYNRGTTPLKRMLQMPLDPAMLNSDQTGYDFNLYLLGSGEDGTSDEVGLGGRQFKREVSDSSPTYDPFILPVDKTLFLEAGINLETSLYYGGRTAAVASTDGKAKNYSISNPFTGIIYGGPGDVSGDPNGVPNYGSGGTLNGKGARGCAMLLPTYTKTLILDSTNGTVTRTWARSGYFTCWLIGADSDGNGSKAIQYTIHGIAGATFTYRVGSISDPTTYLDTYTSEDGLYRPQGVRDWITGTVYGGHNTTGCIIICYDLESPIYDDVVLDVVQEAHRQPKYGLYDTSYNGQSVTGSEWLDRSMGTRRLNSNSVFYHCVAYVIGKDKIDSCSHAASIADTPHLLTIGNSTNPETRWGDRNTYTSANGVSFENGIRLPYGDQIYGGPLHDGCMLIAPEFSLSQVIIGPTDGREYEWGVSFANRSRINFTLVGASSNGRPCHAYAVENIYDNHISFKFKLGTATDVATTLEYNDTVYSSETIDDRYHRGWDASDGVTDVITGKTYSGYSQTGYIIMYYGGEPKITRL